MGVFSRNVTFFLLATAAQYLVKHVIVPFIWSKTNNTRLQDEKVYLRHLLSSHAL